MYGFDELKKMNARAVKKAELEYAKRQQLDLDEVRVYFGNKLADHLLAQQQSNG
jgi:NAD(P)H-flavin reductase